MSDFPLFEKHVGIWEGTYTRLDRETGEVLDRHRSRLICRRAGSTWHQTNIYTWDDGRTETREFAGVFRDARVIFDTPRLKGEAVEADDKVIVLRWVYTDDPGNDYAEIITLVEDGHRSRTWQHFEAGEFVKLTVIDERRVS